MSLYEQDMNQPQEKSPTPPSSVWVDMVANTRSPNKTLWETGDENPDRKFVYP